MNKTEFVEAVKAAGADELVDGTELKVPRSDIILIQPKQPWKNKDVKMGWVKAADRLSKELTERHGKPITVLVLPWELNVLNAEDL